MKTKVLFLLAAVALMSFLWVGCDKKDAVTGGTPTELSGTNWQADFFGITVNMEFVGGDVYLTSNVVGATAKATHTVSGSTVYITFTNVTGDWGGYLQEGMVLNGTYNLSQGKMFFQVQTDNGPITITFNKI